MKLTKESVAEEDFLDLVFLVVAVLHLLVYQELKERVFLKEQEEGVLTLRCLLHLEVEASEHWLGMSQVDCSYKQNNEQKYEITQKYVLTMKERSMQNSRS